MASIIALMKELKYPTNEEGVCHGLALMAERARRAGEYHKFKSRIKFLNRLPEGRLAGLIAEAKAREAAIREAERLGIAPPPDTRTPREKKDHENALTTEAFFFQVWAHFQPSAMQTFLDTEGSTFTQLDTHQVEMLMYDAPENVPQPVLSLTKPDSFLVCTTQENKHTPLLVFLHNIQKSAVSTGLVISSSGHTVHLFYDKEKKKWRLMDHHRPKNFPSFKEAMEGLNAIFATNGVSNLAIDVYTDDRVPRNEKEMLMKNLKIISRNSIHELIRREDSNRADANGSTALYIAAKYGDIDSVERLQAQEGIDISYPTNRGVSPLQVASVYGRANVVEHLLKHPNINVNAPLVGHSPLRLAISFGYANVANVLLAHPDINLDEAAEILENKTLTNNLKISDKCILQAKLYARLGYRKKENRAYFDLLSSMSVEQSQKSDLWPELEKNIKDNLSENQLLKILYLAAEEGNLSVVERVLNLEKLNVSQVNQPIKDGFSVLNAAAENGHLEVVKFLIEHGADVNQPVEDGSTALLLAAEEGHTAVVEYLLTCQGIKLNLENEDGETALSVATASGHTDIVNALSSYQTLVAEEQENSANDNVFHEDDTLKTGQALQGEPEKSANDEVFNENDKLKTEETLQEEQEVNTYEDVFYEEDQLEVEHALKYAISHLGNKAEFKEIKENARDNELAYTIRIKESMGIRQYPRVHSINVYLHKEGGSVSLQCTNPEAPNMKGNFDHVINQFLKTYDSGFQQTARVSLLKK